MKSIINILHHLGSPLAQCTSIFDFKGITHTHIPVYNTCTLLLNKQKYVDANLDESDNAISDNESLSEMLTSQSQIPE